MTDSSIMNLCVVSEGTYEVCSRTVAAKQPNGKKICLCVDVCVLVFCMLFEGFDYFQHQLPLEVLDENDEYVELRANIRSSI